MVEFSTGFSENYEPESKDPTTLKEVITRHIKKISDLCCKEFTGSYWEKKPIRTANGIMFSEIYHDDKREAYCNAIDFLIDILYPIGDEKFKEYLKKYEGYDEESNKKDETSLEIGQKIKLKRETFRQINLMFNRIDFWSGSGGYDE